jgi:hypothetical protein
MNQAMVTGDKDLMEKALNILEWHMELGWDKEYGGFVYFADVDGRFGAARRHFNFRRSRTHLLELQVDRVASRTSVLGQHRVILGAFGRVGRRRALEVGRKFRNVFFRNGNLEFTDRSARELRVGFDFRDAWRVGLAAHHKANRQARVVQLNGRAFERFAVLDNGNFDRVKVGQVGRFFRAAATDDRSQRDRAEEREQLIFHRLTLSQN